MEIKKIGNWLGLSVLCVVILPVLGKDSGTAGEFSYVNHVLNPFGVIQKNLQLQRDLAPLLHSQDFWDWLEHLNNRRSQLRMAVLSDENNATLYNSTESKETSPATSSVLNLIDSIVDNVTSSLLNSSLTGSPVSVALGGNLGQLLGSLLSGLQSSASIDSNISSNGDLSASKPNAMMQQPALQTSTNTGLAQSFSNILSSFVPQSNASSVEFIFQQIREAIKNSNASETCKRDSIMVSYGLQSQQPWALRMFDASAKIPTSLLNLDVFWTGSYDECYSDSTIADMFLRPKTSMPPVDPRYCLVVIPLPIPGSTAVFSANVLRLGTCLPKSCNNADTAILANLVLSSIPPLGNFSISASSGYCQPTPEEVPYETKDIAMIVLLSVLGFIALAGTTYDVIAIEIPKYLKNRRDETEDDTNFSNLNASELSNGKSYNLRHANGTSNESTEKNAAETKTPTPASENTKKKKGVIVRLLLAFSLYTNGKKILSTTQPKGALTAVNGIRFLSMSWVILGHCLGFVLGFSSNVIKYYTDFMQTTSALAISNALVSVDTFFVLSGLLTSYLLLREMEKKTGRVNWFLFYFHRYWRLTPIYMIMIGIFATLFNHMMFGPARPLPDSTCDKYWWMNMLYINNFVNEAENLCLAWSWYLNNDMQFYVLSPLLIVPLFYKEVIGVVVSVAFLLGVTITSGVISYTYKIPPSTVGGGDQGTDSTYFMTMYYIRPYCRMGPYICGVLTGYILHKTKGKCKINKYVNLVSWIIAAVCASSVLYGLAGAFKGEHLLNVEESAVYNALHRTVWGAAVSWVIFACATGNGGFVNTILSWSPFVPLSRLTYAAYLDHLIVLYVFYFNHTRKFYITNYALVYLFLGNLVASYAAAFVLSLLFEAPFMALEKIIFPSRSKK